MPNGEHGLMPGAMLVDAHSGGQEVAGGVYRVQSGVQTNTNGMVEHRTHKPVPPFQVGSSSFHSQTTYVMHTRLAVRNHQAIGVQAQLRHHKQRHHWQELTSTAGQSEQGDGRMSANPLMLGMPAFLLLPIVSVSLSSVTCTEELGQ